MRKEFLVLNIVWLAMLHTCSDCVSTYAETMKKTMLSLIVWRSGNALLDYLTPKPPKTVLEKLQEKYQALQLQINMDDLRRQSEYKQVEAAGFAVAKCIQACKEAEALPHLDVARGPLKQEIGHNLALLTHHLRRQSAALANPINY